MITVDELAVRLRLSSDEKVEYNDLLSQIVGSVAAVIETYCNRSFTGVVDVTEKYDIECGQTVLLLKHVPIVDVVSVTLQNSVLEEGSDYYVYKDAGKIVFPKSLTLSAYGPQVLEITYSYGYSEVPRDIKEIALQLGAAMFNRAASEGISGESIGDYKVEYEDYLFHLRYSTEWSLAREILEHYRITT